MFDLNTIINAALNAAVNARITEVLQQHANTIAPLVEQIHNLDAICQAQAERIEKLENNPAQGVDMTPTTGLTRAQVEDLIEAKMDLHLECYDHDNYDEMANKLDDLPDFDDFVKDGDMRDSVRSEIEYALNNATFSVSI